MNKKMNRPITHASLMLTEDCNFACEYCFVKNHPKEMTWETAKQAVDWLVAQNKDTDNIMNINFFGGEPTLRWDMIERVVEYGKKQSDNLTFGMTTNGSLLTEERLDYCEKNHISILFSVDGPEHVQNVHRKMRGSGKGSFKKIEWAMKECVKRGLSGTGRVTYTPKTLPYLFETVKYLFEEIGFRDVAPTPAVDSYLPFSDEDYKEYDKQFEKIDKYYKEKIKAGENPGLNYYGKCFRQITRDEAMPGPCGAGKGYVGISTDGGLYPCHRFTQWAEWTLGNVWSSWTNEVRLQFLDFDINKLNETCGKCTNLFCGGTCLAANYNNTGKLHTPGKDSCKMSKIQFERAEKILHEMKDEPNFRKAFSKYIKGDKSGIFKDKPQPKKPPQNKNEPKQIDLRLINNRINNLENMVKNLTKLVQKQDKLIGAMGRVLLDTVEGGEKDGRSYNS